MVKNSKGFWVLSKKEKEERQSRCIEYLLRYGNSLPAARKAAARDHFLASSSVWITALSKILGNLAEGEDL